MKRRLKRIREKGVKESGNSESKESVWNEEDPEDGGGEQEAEVDVSRIILSDLLERSEVIRCAHRVRSCAFR